MSEVRHLKTISNKGNYVKKVKWYIIQNDKNADIFLHSHDNLSCKHVNNYTSDLKNNSIDTKNSFST